MVISILHRTAVFAACLCLCELVSGQSITPNTRQLNVASFYHLNTQTGDFDRYQAIGFYEPPVGAVPPRVHLMPQITVKSGGIAFIGRDGKTIKDEDDADQSTVARVKISLVYHAALPTPAQQIGVLAQVFGSGDTTAYPDMKTADFKQAGVPTAFLHPNVKAQTEAELKDIASTRTKQKELLSKWPQTMPQVVAISGVTISLLVDGEVSATRTIPAYLISSGVLPDLFLPDPSESTINRVKERKFQIQIDFGFLDAKVGSINAEFDFDVSMRRLVSESRSLQSKSKSRGVQILGFGSRRSSLSQFMKEKSEEQISQDNRAGTTIQMRDADDSIISMFESRFFPQLTKADLVNAHLESGKAAESGGNQALAAAHFGYAKAISEERPNMDVDTAGALASLSEGDYAGFLAKGIKMQKSEGSTASQYSRVITKNFDTKQEIQWTAVRAISTQRKVSQIIEVGEDRRKPSLGLCYLNSISILRPLPFVPPGYRLPPPPPPVQALIPTCLLSGGPMDRAGVSPYDAILSIDDLEISPSTSMQDIDSVMAKFNAGDQIEIRRFGGFTNTGEIRSLPVKVRLGKDRFPKE